MEKCIEEVKVALIIIYPTLRISQKNSFENDFTIMSYECLKLFMYEIPYMPPWHKVKTDANSYWKIYQLLCPVFWRGSFKTTWTTFTKLDSDWLDREFHCVQESTDSFQ